MAIPLTINGATFEYPENFDENWGIEATGWAQAVTNGMLQMSGGNFPLTADINFGPNFGLLSKYFETRSAVPATTGTVRLSSADAGIAFRNNANSGNLVLTTNSADILLFNGTPVGTSGALTNSHIFVGNASNIQADVAMSGDITITNTGVTTIGAGTVTNAKIASAAAISVNKLAALSASQIVVSDASGFLTTTSSPTLTEIAFVGGVTSAIQTQINTKAPSNNPTFTGTVTVPNASSNTSAAAFGQLPAQSGTITNFVVYTPSFVGFGTPSSVNVYWRRVGDTVEIRGTWTNGTVTGSSASITLPNSIVTDNTGKVQSTQGCGNVLGSNTSTSTPRYVIASANSNTVNFSFASNTTNGLQAQNANSMFATGENVAIQFAVPIQTWSI